VAVQVLEYLLELDHFRGVGRLFVPWIVQAVLHWVARTARGRLKYYDREVIWVFWPYGALHVVWYCDSSRQPDTKVATLQS